MALLRGEIVDEHGASIGEIDRSLSHDTGVAQHGGFRLNGTRGVETAKHVLRQNIAYYRQLGLSRVEMYAGLDRGGYAWAKYGFAPTRDWWDALRPMLRDRISVPALNIATADRQAILNLLENGDPRTVWDIADSRMPVSVVSGTLPLGKLLLSGTSWKGSLDLNDASALRRFHAYFGPTA
jgi:hypothetical protein